MSEPLDSDELAKVRYLVLSGRALTHREAAVLLATVDAERARAERAEAERDAAYAVIRRYHDHWQLSLRHPDTWECNRPRPSPVRRSQPMTDAEAAAFRAATEVDQ